MEYLWMIIVITRMLADPLTGRLENDFRTLD